MRTAIALLVLATVLPMAAAAQDDDMMPGCAGLLDHPVPDADLPTAKQRAAARGCESQALMDAGDFSAARACAYLEREAGNETVFGGSATLFVLYANGQGVARDLDLARRFVCEAGGAPAEVEGRLATLDRLESGGSTDERVDFCDDITSGYMSGFCAEREAVASARVRDEKWQVLLAGWSTSERAAWTRLEAAAKAFFDARVESEVDVSGSARGAFIVGEREQLANDLYEMVAAFERGELPAASAAELAAADARLNASYAAARKAAAFENEDDLFGPLGTIRPEGIRTTERVWIKYRDAWIAFGKVRYPDVSADAWAEYFTRKRDAQLRELFEGM